MFGFRFSCILRLDCVRMRKNRIQKSLEHVHTVWMQTRANLLHPHGMHTFIRHLNPVCLHPNTKCTKTWPQNRLGFRLFGICKRQTNRIQAFANTIWGWVIVIGMNICKIKFGSVLSNSWNFYSNSALVWVIVIGTKHFLYLKILKGMTKLGVAWVCIRFFWSIFRTDIVAWDGGIVPYWWHAHNNIH